MENLHKRSFNKLCGVVDWLIISGLNAILPCAYTKDSFPNSAVARQSTSLQDDNNSSYHMTSRLGVK